MVLLAERLLGDREAVVFRAIPTNQRIPAIQSGQVDMVVRTMTVNCDRIKDVAFSTAYFETGQQVLAPKTSDITGYNDTLKGKKVCSAAGSTAETALKENSFGADIRTTVPNQLDCLVRLQLGEVDAVVTDSALAAGQAAQDPTVELKGDKPFTTEYYGVAMKKDADDLVRRGIPRERIEVIYPGIDTQSYTPSPGTRASVPRTCWTWCPSSCATVWRNWVTPVMRSGSSASESRRRMYSPSRPAARPSFPTRPVAARGRPNSA